MNILLTGEPGVGKSTIIQKVLELIGFDRATGFWTKEIRDHGRRSGFLIQTTDGEEGILAHVNNSIGPRIGKYVVNVKDIEAVILPAMERARKSDCIIIIDEIASMELKSLQFAPEVRRCLDTGRVLGTIQQRSGSVQDEIKSRLDVRLVEVKHENRDVLPAQIIRML